MSWQFTSKAAGGALEVDVSALEGNGAGGPPTRDSGKGKKRKRALDFRKIKPSVGLESDDDVPINGNFGRENWTPEELAVEAYKQEQIKYAQYCVMRRRQPVGVAQVLEIADFGVKGKGLRLRPDAPPIEKHTYMFEYAGKFLKSAEELEAAYRKYEGDEWGKGSYIWDLTPTARKYKMGIDGYELSGPGTDNPDEPDNRFTRRINHGDEGERATNLRKREFTDDSKRPHVLFFASRRIMPGDELLYDYGPEYAEDIRQMLAKRARLS